MTTRELLDAHADAMSRIRRLAIRGQQDEDAMTASTFSAIEAIATEAMDLGCVGVVTAGRR